MSRSNSPTERNSPPEPETTCSTRPDTRSLAGSNVAWSRTTNARWTESVELCGFGCGVSTCRLSGMSRSVSQVVTLSPEAILRIL